MRHYDEAAANSRSMIAEVLWQGGIKAVVWTDAVQMLILLVGLIAVAVLGSVRAGGAAAVWRIAVDTGRVNYSEYVPSLQKETRNIRRKKKSKFRTLFSCIIRALYN